MPYLALLEREDLGCKIAVDGHCFGQRLSTAIFHFKPYKITENERENDKPKILAFLVLVKNLNFSNLSFPESTGPTFKQQEAELVVQQNAVWRKRKKQGKRKGR